MSDSSADSYPGCSLALCLHDQDDEEASYLESPVRPSEEVASRISDKEYLATFPGKGNIGRKPRSLAFVGSILLEKMERRWSMAETILHLKNDHAFKWGLRMPP
jgi:hypothetical protein